MKKKLAWLMIVFCLILGGAVNLVAANTGKNGLKVLVTTFPIYQITRNVTKGVKGVDVQLLLPSQLGCPHDYALTPQDLRKLSKANILIVNGLGMEEFLGAPVKKVNANLLQIDSSKGVKNLLEFTEEQQHEAHDHHEHKKHHEYHEKAEEHHHGEAPFEWAGAFKLKPGVYKWTFAKKDGKYADPQMKLLMLVSDERKKIEGVEEKAEKVFSEKAVNLTAGGVVPAGALQNLQFDKNAEKTIFTLNIKKPGIYVFFTEHMPGEFEAKEHFFKTAAGKDVEPFVAEPDSGCEHHHHSGANPHLFASPRMVARLANNIAAGLAKADSANAAAYEKNARAYAMKMNKLADEMSAVGKSLANNRIIQPHGIFDYLARDIGLEIVGVMQPHGAEPSAAEMLALVKKIREKKVGAIFTEPQFSDKVGRTLAKETGIPVAVLDPVASGPENAPLDYYEKTMQKNMKTLEKNLGKK